MTTKQARILVLRGGAIGDFILTLPALHALRRRWPDAYIELIGYPHIADLAVTAGIVNRVQSLERAEISRFFSRRPEFPDDQVAFIRSFDIIVSYLHDSDGLVKDNLLLAGGRTVLYGSPIVTEGHAVEFLMRPLASLAIYPENEICQLALGDTAAQAGRRLLMESGVKRDPVVLHPGSGSRRKNWPVDRFMDVARRLRDKRDVCFLLGEADHSIEKPLRNGRSDIPLIMNLDLQQVAALLSASSLYVGNDSGITHLASALGLPGVALFGPSDPARWGPRGARMRILRGEEGSLDRIDVEMVMLEVAGLSS